MRPWEQALEEHLWAVERMGYKRENILGIFAYGSQNYGVATENSDWDTKAIIVPDWQNLVLRPPVSMEIHLANEEHCEVKDIREIANMFKKQNINFVEILFTEYKWINPLYQYLWRDYFENMKHDIAHYDINKTVKSVCGQAIHTLKQNPENGKKVANGYRLVRFLENYLAGANYRDCIVLPENEREVIIFMKKTDIVNPDLATKMIEKLESLKEQDFELDKEHAAAVASRMEEGILNIISLAINLDNTL